MSIAIQTSFFDYKDLFLPVQALRDVSMEHVLGIDEIYEAATIECDTNGLSKGILFFEERNGIMTPAEISPVNGEYQIAISLTFCQFVWAVGLYMTVYFDNIVQIPNMNAAGTNIHGYKANKDYLEYANEQFRLARSLIWGYNHDVFFELPNICDPLEFSEPVGKANGILVGGVAFLFCHELSHNILGHTHKESTDDESVAEEAAADNYAIEFLSDTFDRDFGFNHKVGAVTVLCSLLVMGKDSISGGSRHPHMDYRIRMMMTKLNLHEMDCLWGYVGSALRLWLLVYGGLTIQEDMNTGGFNFYKDFYEHYLRLLTQVREQRYPKLVKPVWYVE